MVIFLLPTLKHNQSHVPQITQIIFYEFLDFLDIPSMLPSSSPYTTTGYILPYTTINKYPLKLLHQAMVVGESRTELLQWLNSTLQLDYSKVEQCGTGAAYCQIMDSIYGGVPMMKVKFGANLSDYDARNNMKILQAAFNKHHISKQIEVERLIKCRLQDNLELLQWFKRHWMENKDVNTEYDASAQRRSGSSTSIASGSGPSSRRSTMGSSVVTRTPGSRRVSSSSSGTSVGGANIGTISVQKRRVVLGGPGGSVGAFGGSSGAGIGTGAGSRNITPTETARQLAEMARELENACDELGEAKILIDSLETERNFYFNKLREIEILTQNIQDQYNKDDETAMDVKLMSVLDVIGQIQEILYLTEKGFEVQDSIDAELF